MKRKHKTQVLTLQVTAAGQTVDNSINLDDRFPTIESISAESNFYNAPARCNEISFDGDSSIFDKGIKLSYFQALHKERQEVEKENGGTRKFYVSLTDETTGAFVPYYVQFNVKLSNRVLE
jgi:hypothetical protein